MTDNRYVQLQPYLVRLPEMLEGLASALDHLDYLQLLIDTADDQHKHGLACENLALAQAGAQRIAAGVQRRLSSVHQILDLAPTDLPEEHKPSCNSNTPPS